MTKENYVQTNWGDFLQSPEFESLEDYPVSLIKNAIQELHIMMDQSGYPDPKKC